MTNPSKMYNLVRFATATTGTGTMAIGSAISGFLSPSAAGASDGDVISYSISDGINSEAGQGTYHTASGGTVSRDTVYASTNTGSRITLSGFANVSFTMAAQDFNALQVIPTPVSYAPTDQSGAGLTLSGLYCSYMTIGNLCLVDIGLTWPTTTNTAQAAFSIPHNAYSHPTFLGFGTVATLLYVSSSIAYLYTFAGGTMTNAAMSGLNVNASFTYRWY